MNSDSHKSAVGVAQRKDELNNLRPNLQVQHVRIYNQETKSFLLKQVLLTDHCFSILFSNQPKPQ